MDGRAAGGLGGVRSDPANCSVEELLFVVFARDVVFEGSVGDGARDCVLDKIAATVGCGVLLEFVEFTDGTIVRIENDAI